jgi:hypothetical protein
VRLFVVLLLVGCTVEPDTTQAIKVTFVKDTSEVRQRCGNTPLEPYGCAKQHRSEINPKGSCEIIAIRPTGFDDHEAVKTLGHELLHCLWGPVHI